MQYFIYVNLHKFIVTVCEADCTTSTESDSTVCYDSNSSNCSVSSGPKFIEDDSDTDDNLPEIQPCSFDGPGALPPPATPAAPGTPHPKPHPQPPLRNVNAMKTAKTRFFIQINNFFALCLSPFFISID